MKHYTIRLELKSPTLIGSGEGFGSLIDTDIVFDEAGIPFVPAKRIKGCLKDSALEVKEMCDCSSMNCLIDINKTFGEVGDSKSAPVYFSNLTINNYGKNKAWLEYYLYDKKHADIISRESILQTFTEIRQQTAIMPESGVAKDGSLRTIRVVKKDLIFYGDVRIEDESVLNTVLFASLNFRFMGTKRNRGFGEIHCSLLDNEKTEIQVQQKLEEICTA